MAQLHLRRYKATTLIGCHPYKDFIHPLTRDFTLMPNAKTPTSEHLRLNEAAHLAGVCTATLRNWANQGLVDHYLTPFGQRMFHKESILALTRGVCPPEQTQQDVVYCRVSSKKQENDLARQVALLRTAYPNAMVVTDIASGLNWHRKGLKTILELAMSGRLRSVVVANRDRLARFAFELIEWIITNNGGRLIVHDPSNGGLEQTSEQELAEDILSIVHVYSCRQMGRRRYRKRKEYQSTDQANSRAEGPLSELVRDSAPSVQPCIG